MKKHFPVFCAFPAAVLYALNAPVSKLLLKSVPPTMMAAFLYLGAGADQRVLCGSAAYRRGAFAHFLKNPSGRAVLSGASAYDFRNLSSGRRSKGIKGENKWKRDFMKWPGSTGTMRI